MGVMKKVEKVVELMRELQFSPHDAAILRDCIESEYQLLKPEDVDQVDKKIKSKFGTDEAPDYNEPSTCSEEEYQED